MQILPVLANRHEVVAMDGPGPSCARSAAHCARVVRYDPAILPWREINDGAISIYHLGNQPDLHGGIWQVSVRQPGHRRAARPLPARFFLHALGPLTRRIASAILPRWSDGMARRAAGRGSVLRGGYRRRIDGATVSAHAGGSPGALGVITHSQGGARRNSRSAGMSRSRAGLPVCGGRRVALPANGWRHEASRPVRRTAWSCSVTSAGTGAWGRCWRRLAGI
jgi:hypothetical protein